MRAGEAGMLSEAAGEVEGLSQCAGAQGQGTLGNATPAGASCRFAEPYLGTAGCSPAHLPLPFLLPPHQLTSYFTFRLPFLLSKKSVWHGLVPRPSEKQTSQGSSSACHSQTLRTLGSFLSSNWASVSSLKWSCIKSSHMVLLSFAD